MIISNFCYKNKSFYEILQKKTNTKSFKFHISLNYVLISQIYKAK